MSRVFNGSSDYATYTGALLTTPPFTIAAWAKSDVTDAVTRTIASIGSPSGDDDYHSLQRYGATSAYVYSKQSSGPVFGDDSVTGATASVWHHHAGVWATTSSRVPYLNGTAGTGDTTSVSPASHGEFVVGARASATNLLDLWDGKIAHVAIWNIALSGSDITLLKNGANPLAVQAGNLVAYWPLAGTASPEPDDVGSADLTLTGTTGDAGDNPTVDAPPSGGGGGAAAKKNILLMG